MARKSSDDRNMDQVIRKDGKGCFVEVLCDGYGYNKIHLQFATYDKTRPEGQRQTNNVHIYIDVPTFLMLTEHIINGSLQQTDKNEPFYEALGGTDAKYLSTKRQDGKSQSRVFQIWPSNKGYFLTAMSGPGETQPTGIITPLFGNKPEQKVSVPLTKSDVEEIFLMTRVDYQAWRTAKHTMEWKSRQARYEKKSNPKDISQQQSDGSAAYQNPEPPPPNPPYPVSNGGYQAAAPPQQQYQAPMSHPQQQPSAPAYPPQQQHQAQPAMLPQGQVNYGSQYGSMNGTVNGSAGADDTRIF